MMLNRLLHVCEFMPAFGAPFARPIATPGGAAAVPWYLSGGVSAANCAAAYQPKGAASLAASYINLANPGTNNAAPGVAPTFDAATGWTFNGTTQYLLTPITPATNQTTSLIVRFTNAGADLVICGTNNGVDNRFGIWPNNTGTGVAYQNGGALSVLPAIASGVLAVAGNSGYRNGVAESGSISAWTGAAGYAIALGGRNGASINLWSGKIQAVAIYNVTLTAPQVAAIAATMAAL